MKKFSLKNIFANLTSQSLTFCFWGGLLAATSWYLFKDTRHPSMWVIIMIVYGASGGITDKTFPNLSGFKRLLAIFASYAVSLLLAYWLVKVVKY